MHFIPRFPLNLPGNPKLPSKRVNLALSPVHPKVPNTKNQQRAEPLVLSESHCHPLRVSQYTTNPMRWSELTLSGRIFHLEIAIFGAPNVLETMNDPFRRPITGPHERVSDLPAKR